MIKQIVFCTILSVILTFSSKPNVVINEFLASNQSDIEDKFGNNEDWIELYNKSNQVVNLQGYFLSDDEDNHYLWEFPDTTIQPHGFLIVFASGNDVENGELHSNFRISLEGEPLFLSDPDSNLIDHIPAVELLTDYTYGRYPDGSEDFYILANPTPDAPNNGEDKYIGITEEPEILTDAGFYQDSVIVEIAQPDPGVEIRYTKDGSVPTASSAIYTEPIVLYDRFGEPNEHSMLVTSTLGGFHGWDPPKGELFKAHTIRAKAYRTGHVSNEVTSTYFIDSLPEMRYDLPVWSITTDHDNFFGNQNGLFIPQNYLNRGFDWERPAYIEFFEEDGERVFSTWAGVRTHGGASRHYPQKTLRLYARNLYGSQYFEYPFFGEDQMTNSGEEVLDEFKRLLLRSSGNDWPFSLYKDAMLQSLMEGTHTDLQAYRPSVAFINGEFWGIHNIRERQDRFYFATHYNLDPDNVVVLSRDRNTGQFHLNDGEEGDEQHYQNLENIVEHDDITDPGVYETVRDMMEVNSFIDHQIINIFIGNTDWPGNNIKYYRYKGTEVEDNDRTDGRWRWITFDLDFSLGYSNTPTNHNTLAFATSPGGFAWPNPDWSTMLLRRLLSNEDFKIKFINRFADHLNTRLHPDFIADRIDEIADVIESTIPYQMHRWQRPVAMSNWHNYAQNYKNYTAERPGHVYDHMMDYFDLSDTFNVELNVNHNEAGKIKFSTLTHEEFPFSGKYFAEVPILIKAIPEDGYEFVKWEETGDSLPVKQIVLESDTQFTAVFQVSTGGSTDLPFTYPALHDVCAFDYVFNYWSPQEPALTYPPNMLFHCQSETNEPDAETTLTYNYTCAYNLDNRPRINGLGVSGLSFINTGNPQNDETCMDENGWVGAAVIGLSTQGCENIQLSFTAGTVLENSRIQKLRLQFKTSIQDEWQNFEPFTEYTSAYDLHFTEFGPIDFPTYLEDQDTVYLRWLYFQAPESGDSGPRAQIRLDDILIEVIDDDTVSVTELTTQNVQIYPNPGIEQFTIELPEMEHYKISVLNVLNQKISEQQFYGDKWLQHTEKWPAGLYMIRLQPKNALSTPLLLKWMKQGKK